MPSTCIDPHPLRVRLSSPARRSVAIAAAVAAVLGVMSAPAARAQVPSVFGPSSPAQSSASSSSSENSASSGSPTSGTTPEDVQTPRQGAGIHAGPVTILFGGFTEEALIYRNHDEFADVGSVPYGSIPFPTSEPYNVNEFRESARQSRFSMLTQADPWDGARIEAYLETDFLGAAPTANSRESNSYNLRMRQFYAQYITDYGFSILAGQSWSLATLYTQGLEPRKEDVPATIDAQYVTGFNWTRNPQLRFTEKFSDAFSLGFSIESPQSIPSDANNVPSTLSAYPANTYYENSGPSASGLLDSETYYTIDPAPDLIVKAAFDPGYGHYEIYGLGRWFRSAVATSTNTVFGGSVGAGAILPIIPDVLSIQASGLIGKGNGRYGSSQLTDVVLEPNGDFSPMKEYQALIGLFYKPIETLQIYGYAGREQESANYFDATIGTSPTVYGYGIGNPLYINTGCYTLGGKCQGNAQQSDELTAGFWWKFYRGQIGYFVFGLQGAYNQLNYFPGVGGAPSTNVFEVMASFRYYPFQK